MTLKIPALSNKHKTFLIIVLLGILSIIASTPLFSDGWFSSHEGTTPIERVLLLTFEIENHFYYPRWLSLTYGGMGSPFFNFYSPAFYLTAAYLHVLGIPLLVSVKILCGILFFLGSAGMFLWTRRHYSTSGALLSAVLYLYAPYHFVDIYVRGALAEFSALAFLPFLFWGIDLSFSESRKYRGIFLVAFTSATIVLLHNLSAFMIALFALLYFLFAAYRSKGGLCSILEAIPGPLAGAGLSAFYWLPVVFEVKYLNRFEASMTGGFYQYENHFVHIPQLYSTFWGFGPSSPGPSDEMSFQIGFAILIFAFIALVILACNREVCRDYALVLLPLGMLAVFFTTTLSSWVYVLFPWYWYVQFPWRFLGPATLFLSAFAGLAANADNFDRPIFRFFVTSLVAIAIGLCLIFSVGQRKVAGREPELALLDSKQGEKNFLTGRSFEFVCAADEYLPRWCYPWTVHSRMSIPLRPIAAGARFENLVIRGSGMSFYADVADNGTLVTIPWLFFPGWQATIDGHQVTVLPGRKGFLTFSLPNGRHTVEVRFGSTTVRTVGWYASAATLCIIALYYFYVVREWKRGQPLT